MCFCADCEVGRFRPPGTGRYSVDCLRPGMEAYEDMRQRPSLPSISAENLAFVLEHSLETSVEEVFGGQVSEEELYILSATFNHKHKWVCFPDRYWFRAKDQRLGSEFRSLVQRKLLVTHDEFLSKLLRIQALPERCFQEVVEILVVLHRNALEAVYYRLAKKHPTRGWTQVGLIARILQSMKPLKVDREGVPVYAPKSVQRFISATTAAFSTTTIVVRLEESLNEKLLNVHERFFLDLGVSPAEAATMLRLKLSSIGFTISRSERRERRGDSAGLDTPNVVSNDFPQLVALQDEQRIAILCGNKELAFEATHRAASLCMDMECDSSAAAPKPRLTREALIRARLIFSIVFQGAHLLERQKEYDLAIHYLLILLQRFDANRFPLLHAKVVLRLSKDYEHLGTSSGIDKALEVLESCIGSPGCVVDKDTQRNKLGGYGASMIRALVRLSVPPRRWKVRIAHLQPLRECENLTLRSEALSYRQGESSVEQVVLDHFKQKGWEGDHVENGTLLTLYGIILWDVLHHPCPQSTSALVNLSPLELYGSWDSTRLEALEGALANVAANAEEVLAESYTHNYGNYARGVNWQRNSLAELSHLCKVIRSENLAKIFRILSQNYMAWCNGKSFLSIGLNKCETGMPDLLLWNRDSVRFVEVKGPGKRKALCIYGDI